ncbi:MAG: cadmium resistance transporter [Dysgonamonadaceae bacterium]|mgnify:CR=1 FL=1|jgi:cadmium resistance transport/sequestration family protein|nr:cadmium resistance transporter [Dysgonamonadaceae bacterium]MDD3308678.1 cadmium resistance transporter [Dysgonamonadaceae bacterium]MDD3899730.1 cadmium resistance transporter [Dysgonamonadaceae bacterium]MDD4397991.1 cadmium resistance transporter [Dysgonamonadaceae bacterium]MEA5081640.1 cadmium resistance transporter [Dysgonamonadaceae bacterium]
MISIIFSALFTYIATSIDELPILFMLYTKKSNRGKARIITGAYFLGTFILVGIGVLGAFGLGLFIPHKILGLLGLIPIAIGIKVFFEKEDDEEKEAEKVMSKHSSLILQILAITIGLGTDDLAVYIPLFTALSGTEFLVMTIVFAIATALLCFISFKLTSIKPLTQFIEKFEHPIVGAIFVLVGFFILYETGNLSLLVIK